jgi:hypothetical protein
VEKYWPNAIRYFGCVNIPSSWNSPYFTKQTNKQTNLFNWILTQDSISISVSVSLSLSLSSLFSFSLYSFILSQYYTLTFISLIYLWCIRECKLTSEFYFKPIPRSLTPDDNIIKLITLYLPIQKEMKLWAEELKKWLFLFLRMRKTKEKQRREMTRKSSRPGRVISTKEKSTSWRELKSKRVWSRSKTSNFLLGLSSLIIRISV